MTAVAAVVVTHASGAVLPRLLASLAAHEPDLQVVVVDSGSPNGPPTVPDGVGQVALGNVGYGAACNAGVAVAIEQAPEVDVLALLNPDVELTGPTLTRLAAELRDRPTVGLATGPLVDGGGRPAPSAWGPTSVVRALWFGTGWQWPRLRRTLGRVGSRGSVLTSGASMGGGDVRVDGHILGGAMVARRSCWEQLQGFDEDFFLYWEDADLCRRARNAGWEVRVLPVPAMIHRSGTSSSGIADEQRWEWYVEGARRFAEKHLDAARGRRLIAALRLGRRLRRR